MRLGYVGLINGVTIVSDEPITTAVCASAQDLAVVAAEFAVLGKGIRDPSSSGNCSAVARNHNEFLAFADTTRGRHGSPSLCKDAERSHKSDWLFFEHCARTVYNIVIDKESTCS